MLLPFYKMFETRKQSENGRFTLRYFTLYMGQSIGSKIKCQFVCARGVLSTAGQWELAFRICDRSVCWIESESDMPKPDLAKKINKRINKAMQKWFNATKMQPHTFKKSLARSIRKRKWKLIAIPHEQIQSHNGWNLEQKKLKEFYLRYIYYTHE